MRTQIKDALAVQVLHVQKSLEQAATQQLLNLECHSV